MALTGNERVTRGLVTDNDGRVVVTGPDGVPITGGSGGGGSDPLSDGTPGGALPTKTLWIAGADGSVLRGIAVDSSARVRTVVENTVGVTGPLTDTQLRASAVPVSGSFFQATQPVSGPLTDTQLRASSVPVTGPLTDTQLRASAVPVSGTVNIGSAPQVAVNNVETLADNAGFTDGTSKLFPQGYVYDDVAGTALTENDVAAARIDSKRAVVTVTEDGVTRGRYATVKAASTAAAATDPAQVVSLSPNSPVTPPTLTKGTQGATGFSTQDLKDAGRVHVMWTVSPFVTTGTAESFLTITESRDGAATTTFTSKTITSGKRLRITSVVFNVGAGGSTPTVSRVYLRMRVNTAGATTTSSPLQWMVVGQVGATAKSYSVSMHGFPDGIEFLGNGTTSIGFSIESVDWVTTTNTPQVVVSITAFEY